MGAGFYSPPKCKCFTTFGIGGFCMTQLCPFKDNKKAKKRSKTPREQESTERRNREGYYKAGKFVEVKGVTPILTWRNPAITDEGDANGR